MNNSADENNGNQTNNNSGKWIIVVIICGAAWVGLAPFIGAMLPKEKHLELSGKPPEPLDIAKAASSEKMGLINQTGEARTSPLSADLRANSTANSSKLSGLGLSGNLAAQAPTVAGKAGTAAIQERFHQSIVAMEPARASAPAFEPESGELGVGLKELSALHNAKDYKGLLAKIDNYLATVDKTANARPDYRIIASTLAMQAAGGLNKVDLAKKYGKIAREASRASGNYHMPEIEVAYYQIVGPRANFDEILQLGRAYLEDIGHSRLKDARAKAVKLVELTDILPSDSYYRTQSRIYKVRTQFFLDGDVEAAKAGLLEIRKVAQANNDPDWVQVCDNLINSQNGPI